MAGNGWNAWTWQEMAEHGWVWLEGMKWLEMAENSWNFWKWLEIALNSWKLLEVLGMAGMGLKWLNMAENG